MLPKYDDIKIELSGIVLRSCGKILCRNNTSQLKRCAENYAAVLPMVERERKKWSRKVTESSNALDLEPGVFTFTDPLKIARSLKDSAERSNRRKAGPFQSAMSMLTFYINRAGTQLSDLQKMRLESAKDELRALYGRPRRRHNK